MSEALEPGLRVLINPPAREIGARNVVLRCIGRTHHAVDSPGPLSIKFVMRGTVPRETPTGRFLLDGRFLLILNEGTTYSVHIEAAEPVETFRLFFRRGLIQEAYRDLATPVGRLLDDPGRRGPAPGFFEILRPVDARMVPVIRQMHAAKTGRATDLWLDEPLQAEVRHPPAPLPDVDPEETQSARRSTVRPPVRSPQGGSRWRANLSSD